MSLDGACSESDLPERIRAPLAGFYTPIVEKIQDVVVPGSPPAATPSPGPSARAGVSLIRCADVCTRPEKLVGARVCYHTMTDRIAKLLWDKSPKNVLVVKKWRDSSAASFAFDIASWLLKEHDARVWMTADETDVLPSGVELFAAKCADDVDVIVTIGGDGTVLYTSSLFQGPCPPLLSVAFGSLGFLTAVEPAHAKAAISALMLGHEEPVEFAPRSRIQVTIQRDGADVPETVMFGLNELVVDRGSSPYMTALDAFLDDEYLTVVQADGVLVATPTGSTAYSLSAGGSILFPTVPALMLTPICPHSLSFRPIMFPDSSTLKLVVPKTARASAWACVDGRGRTELSAGDSVTIQMSAFPVPLIAKHGTAKDFLFALTSKLNWNLRDRQLAFEAPAAAAASAKI